MKIFLCRFLPPRNDFLTTMTPAEADLFKGHIAFLRKYTDLRMIVAHGPVLDPAGGWGVSIFELEDGADIAAITAEDPMVGDAGGARYEILPMMHLSTREATS